MDHPSPRTLLLTWGLLAGLTVVSLFTAIGEDGARSTAALGWVSVALILAVTWVKARQILAVYLNLRASTAGWRGFFAALVLVILAVILGGHLLLAA